MSSKFPDVKIKIGRHKTTNFDIFLKVITLCSFTFGNGWPWLFIDSYFGHRALLRSVHGGNHEYKAEKHKSQKQDK